MDAIQTTLDITELVDILTKYLPTTDALSFCLTFNKNPSKSLLQELYLISIKVDRLCYNDCNNKKVEICDGCGNNFCNDCSYYCCNNLYEKKDGCLGRLCYDCRATYKYKVCTICRDKFCINCIKECSANSYCEGYMCDICMNECIEDNNGICSVCDQICCCINDGICTKCTYIYYS
jgi:hypothetical protein